MVLFGTVMRNSGCEGGKILRYMVISCIKKSRVALE